ncbi:MAG: site-2 protease family protein [Candidatus Paceibacterota bacterium]
MILVLTSAPFLIGWAKPVPYNPANLRDQKKGTLWVASAGILANLAIAVFFGIVIRICLATGFLGSSFISLASVIVLLNIVLAIFNLIPIPPLDGSKILFTLLGHRAKALSGVFEKYSLFILLFFIFFIWPLISSVVFALTSFITGI